MIAVHGFKPSLRCQLSEGIRCTPTIFYTNTLPKLIDIAPFASAAVILDTIVIG